MAVRHANDATDACVASLAASYQLSARLAPILGQARRSREPPTHGAANSAGAANSRN